MTDARPRRGRPGYDRAGVLEIAVELFNEQGYDATSVADLAARLGVTKSALYHHYTSKEELLAAALERRRAFDHAVADLVREAQEGGLVRSDVDSAVAARLLFGMLNSLVEWYRPSGPLDSERVAHDVVTVALDGLRTR